MDDKHILVIAEKETFLVKVLIRKIQDAGIGAEFATFDIDQINAHWNSCDIVTCYFDTDEEIPSNVMMFIMDKVRDDDDKQFLVIGDKGDIQHFKSKFPEKKIYNCFERPLDNELFIKSIKELGNKISQGELRKSILVVDDDPTYLGVVREWLKENYKVAVATSGLQAIKWLGKNKADLILLDHEMPVTSGPQVLEMLRSDSETASIPVIFLTGKGDKDSVMAVVALKPQGYLLKNIDKAELLEKITEFFQLNSQN